MRRGSLRAHCEHAVAVRIFTIGVYGSDCDAFFEALSRARIDVFLDLRRRRAVRGPQYAYANARRLTAELERRGIVYRHVLELAPSRELLALQHAIDARESGMRARTALAPEYVRRYTAEVLRPFDFRGLARELEGFRAPVLFCVEREAHACHRSLVAPRLARALRATAVEDIVPPATVGR